MYHQYIIATRKSDHSQTSRPLAEPLVEATWIGKVLGKPTGPFTEPFPPRSCLLVRTARSKPTTRAQKPLADSQEFAPSPEAVPSVLTTLRGRAHGHARVALRTMKFGTVGAPNRPLSLLTRIAFGRVCGNGRLVRLGNTARTRRRRSTRVVHEARH